MPETVYIVSLHLDGAGGVILRAFDSEPTAKEFIGKRLAILEKHGLRRLLGDVSLRLQALPVDSSLHDDA